jgi:hypothetical protein
MMEALKVRGQMENWNDDRLDELARGMRHGFDKVDARFDKVEGEMKEGFAKVDARFGKVEGETKTGFAKVEGEMKEGFEKLQAANERLYRMLFGAAAVIIAALIGVPALGV